MSAQHRARRWQRQLLRHVPCSMGLVTYRPTVLGAQAIADPPLARERILAALTVEGHYPRAAKSLGVSERQLHRLVATLGLAEQVASLVREGRPRKHHDTVVIADPRENGANLEKHDMHVIAETRAKTKTG